MVEATNIPPRVTLPMLTYARHVALLMAANARRHAFQQHARRHVRRTNHLRQQPRVGTGEGLRGPCSMQLAGAAPGTKRVPLYTPINARRLLADRIQRQAAGAQVCLTACVPPAARVAPGSRCSTGLHWPRSDSRKSTSSSVWPSGPTRSSKLTSTFSGCGAAARRSELSPHVTPRQSYVCMGAVGAGAYWRATGEGRTKPSPVTLAGNKFNGTAASLAKCTCHCKCAKVYLGSLDVRGKLRTRSSVRAKWGSSRWGLGKESYVATATTHNT